MDVMDQDIIIASIICRSSKAIMTTIIMSDVIPNTTKPNFGVFLRTTGNLLHNQ
jgi:hypothetical protein